MNCLLSLLPLLAMFFALGHSQARNGQFEVPMTAALKKEILDFHNNVRAGLNANIPNLMIWKKTTQIGCSLFECKPLYGSERGDIFTDWGYGKLYHLVCNYWPKTGHHTNLWDYKDGNGLINENQCRLWGEAEESTDEHL
ncbi:hypothetical protein HELRODRAFT_175423 [Helobdella robusta]|uniref:SCP domain-containing protein n=1 Tax=Helobdella robusta TaxID=6412 RepID=T1F991_HELRO|nr:hypothetical protein HELRODRAFT_175423 [Helobdella robusta]ESO00927.1 hypothetical protein HELRODRAFT_175423 [Helobdella robusta]